jgi:hypothetical protein
MTLVTLLRQAPVAPGATSCQSCDVSIEGSYQDHTPGRSVWYGRRQRRHLCTMRRDTIPSGHLVRH